MATTYNTLSLESKEPRKSRSIAAYVAAGLLVVALAGAGSYVVSNKTSSSINAGIEFNDFEADVVSCLSRAGRGKRRAKAISLMPRYDPDFSTKRNGNKDFYNACYYSFSCCTEVNLACLASEGYGKKCESCLFDNGPKMVIPLCKQFIWESSSDARSPEPGQTWGKKQLLADKGFPKTNVPKFFTQFKKRKKKTCWKPVGSSDPRMVGYVQNCWDAISWCNLLCPRDDNNTVDEKMCKECINLGFQQKAPRRFVNGHTFKEFKNKNGEISGLATRFKGKSAKELAAAKAALEREVIRNANKKE